MKLRFNGIIEKRKSGCNCAGTRTQSTLRMVTSKHYILPSGVSRMFRVGQITEVDDADAEFLLQYKYTENGEKKDVFTVV